jgi:hypothetical protein
MKRSGWVTWAAAATIGESVLPLALGLYAVLDTFGLAPVRGRDPSIFLSGFEDLSLFVILTTVGMWGLISGVGLLRMKQWARYSVIVFAALIAALMGNYLVFGMFATFRGHEWKPIMASWIGTPTSFLAVNIWLLALLNRQRVVREFEGTATSSEVSTQQGQ